MHAPANDLGRVITVNGAGATARLYRSAIAEVADDTTLTIGRLVGIHVGDSLIVGVVVR